MQQYTTKKVMNLATGEPLLLGAEEKSLERMEMQLELIRAGKGSPYLGTEDSLTEHYEFSFMTSYDKLLKIFFANGYTSELALDILRDFGLNDETSNVLLECQTFVDQIKPWFEGITCDGQRAAATLQIVYVNAKRFLHK